MTLSVPDAFIDADEDDAVVVTLAGLDADATAVVSVTVGGVTLDAPVSADGDVVFDLTGQTDGQVTTSVTATDGAGNSTTVAGPSFTLATAPDTSADVDGNLTVTAPDTAIDVLEVGNVSFAVSGLDADATGVVTVTDGTNTVTSNTLAADGTVVLDLSSLDDGSLDVTVTATDGAANSATDMTSITLDTTPLAPGDALIGTNGDDNLVDQSGTSTDIFGLAGDDNLYGGAGNDVLFGGNGRDRLYGGTGADDFVIRGADVDSDRDDIFDFSIVEGDRLDLSDIGTFYGLTPEELGNSLSYRDANGNLQVRLSVETGSTTIAMLRDIDSATFFSDPNALVLDPNADTFIF
jgi:Ca2+-binding RTX toxin-like protein